MKLPDYAVEQNLNFLNNECSGLLRIELSVDPIQLSDNIFNVKAEPNAEIKSVIFDLTIFDKDDYIELTLEEQNLVLFKTSTIKLLSKKGLVQAYTSTHSEITMSEIKTLIATVEKDFRVDPKSYWYGGIDVHHVFFEGLHYDATKDAWEIHWGS